MIVISVYGQIVLPPKKEFCFDTAGLLIIISDPAAGRLRMILPLIDNTLDNNSPLVKH